VSCAVGGLFSIVTTSVPIVRAEVGDSINPRLLVEDSDLVCILFHNLKKKKGEDVADFNSGHGVPRFE
jgi:hypothetical protein